MTRPKQPVQGQAYAKTPQMLGPAPSLPLNSRGEFRMTSPSLCVGDRGHPACPLSSGWCPGAACCPFPPQPGLSGPKEPSICAEDWFFLSVSFFFFPFPSKQNCLAAAPASVPKAVPKGLSCPAEVMAVIPLMGGKTDGTQCPKCTKRAGISRPRRGGKCCRNTPSFGALLGLERAAALAKTCFCQQKPHFTNIQQHKNP